LGFTAATASAVPFYSIDWDSTLALINNPSEGDILIPNGPGTIPPPNVAVPFGTLGILPTVNGDTELDALSFGLEPQLTPNVGQRWSFSVDQYAIGLPAVPGPSVTTEGATGNQQAAGDVYFSNTAAGPLPVSSGANTGLFDGDGNLTPPFPSQGLNLREPTPPVVPQVNENLDALELQLPNAAGLPIYFSLDSAFVDPTTLVPNSGTAAANGFQGGDVLISTGGPPALYASASLLGLNLNGVPDSDDLDALVLWENGVPGFQIPTAPYSWLGPNPTDMLLFSVRRGSNIIGTNDSLLTIPITEGDILLPLALQVPGIFIPAQVLGLNARTPGIINDELDALDVELASITPPSIAIPEPSTFMLLGLGGLLLAVRRNCRPR
jgi:hypothetical protein